jgi:hypothetical protein
MQKVHVVSRPKFIVLFTGANFFGVSLILCTGKWIQIFTETLLAAFNVHFQPIELKLQENQLPHSKEPKMLV